MEDTLIICERKDAGKACGIGGICVKKPAKETTTKEPAKEPAKELGKELGKEPAKEPAKVLCMCVQSGDYLRKDTRCGLNIVNKTDSFKNVKLEIQVQTVADNLGSNIKLKIPVEASNNTTNSTIPINPTNAPVPINNSAINVSLDQSMIILLSVIGVVFVCLVIAVCLLCICCKLKKKTPDKKKGFPISLVKSIIEEERYLPNPQYDPTKPKIDIDAVIRSLSVPSLNKESITDLQKIGEGYFGEVYKGQLHSIDVVDREHLETVAVKMLKGGVNLAAIEDFLREVEIMSSFQHPNILTLIGVCPQGSSTPPWMVFEFMPLGDLAELLRSNNPRLCPNASNLPNLTGKDLLSIALQIASGMEYLAAQRFVHRDLACRNCLVGEGLTVKISDFGMSRDVYTCDYYRIGGTRMLPVRWMAPESVLLGRFTLESDVWSYGVLLWEIYTFGLQPYFGYTNEQVLKLVTGGTLLEIPTNCPNEVDEIIKLCWKHQEKERIQFIDICNRLCILKDRMAENPSPIIPRPPPMPVTVDFPLPYDDDDDDEDFDDDLDEDNYLRPTTLPIVPPWPEPDTEPETEPDTEPETDSETEPATESAIEPCPEPEPAPEGSVAGSSEPEPLTECAAEPTTEPEPKLETNPQVTSRNSYIEITIP
ncbi:muscle, skeletal receptor tyrosine-protein kinase-like [Planococcus citri]|uniref:muscle, skeletal receptor tyrosine-protein kinase-like n=1 Tax=Planococcus citri TaxID=170843 RepID=UPI0031F9D953